MYCSKCGAVASGNFCCCCGAKIRPRAENEKQSLAVMAEAIATLPDEKKQYFIGFAEGVAAMADQVKAKPAEN